MNTGKVLGVVVAGIAAGVLAGILFAPAKGIKTRKRLISKGKGIPGVLKKQFDKLSESIEMKFDEVMDEVFFDDKKIVQPEEEVLQDAQII